MPPGFPIIVDLLLSLLPVSGGYILAAHRIVLPHTLADLQTLRDTHRHSHPPGDYPPVANLDSLERDDSPYILAHRIE